MDLFQSGNVRCLFQLGTPPQPYAIVQNSVDGSLAVVRITPQIYDFFIGAGVSRCQPVTLSEAELAALTPHCVFQVFIGAQTPSSFALVVDLGTGDITIVHISESLFCFYRSLGIPLCPFFDLTAERICQCPS